MGLALNFGTKAFYTQAYTHKRRREKKAFKNDISFKESTTVPNKSKGEAKSEGDILRVVECVNKFLFFLSQLGLSVVTVAWSYI